MRPRVEQNCEPDPAAVRSPRDSFVANRFAREPATQVWRLVAFLVALVLMSPSLAGAQQISGTITDTLGRPLAEVNLELRSENGRTIAHATTDQAGRFQVAPPKRGVYSLVAAKPGFKSANKIVVFPRSAGETISMTLDKQTALTLPLKAGLMPAPNGRLLDRGKQIYRNRTGHRQSAARREYQYHRRADANARGRDRSESADPHP